MANRVPGTESAIRPCGGADRYRSGAASGRFSAISVPGPPPIGAADARVGESGARHRIRHGPAATRHHVGVAAKTVADKLLIRPGSRLWLSHPDRAALLGPLPDGARLADEPAATDVAIAFADDAESLRALLAAQAAGLAAADVLWIAYPKGNRTDVNRDSLWPILAEHGLRPISQGAVDAVWSALRFRALRPDEPPFTGGR